MKSQIPFKFPVSRFSPVSCFIFMMLASLAPTSPAAAQEKSAPGFATREPRYKIGLGDVVDIQFPLVPEFNQTATVQPDGFIPLKSAKDIHIQGLSTPELVESLKTAYKDILHEPVITVTLKDFEKPYFTALGKVNKPGKYDLRGETTVTQAIAMAGGFNDDAKHSQVLLFHRIPGDRFEIKAIDVKAMWKSGKMDEDLQIQPGDMIMVPKSALAKLRPWIPSSSMGMYTNSF